MRRSRRRTPFPRTRYGFAPCTDRFQSLWNALPAGPPAALAAVPLRPTTGLPIASSVCPFFSASVARSASTPLPGADERRGELLERLREVDDHPTLGLPETSCCASVSNVGWSGFHEVETPTLPPSFFHCATKSCWSAVPNASLRAPTLIVALAELREGRRRQHERVGQREIVGLLPDVAVVLERRDLRCARRRRDEHDVVRDRDRLRHRDGRARRHLSDDHVRVLPDLLLCSLDRRGRLRLPVLRVDELNLDLACEPELRQRAVLQADREPHRLVHVAAVRGEVAREGQDGPDLQRERAACAGRGAGRDSLRRPRRAPQARARRPPA